MDNTKRLLAACLATACLATASPARAELDVRWIPPEEPARLLEPTLELERGERMRKHGIAATVLATLQGVVGLGLGVALLVYDEECRHRPCGDGAYGLSLLAPAGLFTASSAIAATAGVPMWIYGTRKERAARKALQLSGSGLRLTF